MHVDSNPKIQCFMSLALLLAMSGCAIDGLFLTEIGRRGHQRMPEPAAVLISGRAPGFGGAAVQAITGDDVLTTATASNDEQASFELQFDGRSEVLNAVLEAVVGGRQVLGVIPRVPGQSSVLDPVMKLDVAQLSPAMAGLDTQTTVLALLVMAKAYSQGRDLSSVPASSMTDTLIELYERMLQGDAALTTFGAIVERLIGANGPIKPFRLLGSDQGWLDAAALGPEGFDYSGDGQPDSDTTIFDQALHKAVDSFDFKACYVPDRIRVVLMVKLASGKKNGNCEAFDPFLWAKDVPGKAMFITGGVHVDTPRCVGERSSQCLSEPQIDALNAVLGNWQPNRIRMYDDGTGGDDVAGDGIWTFSFEAPWWDPQSAPDLAGVRLAYKFTWGNDGDGWTNTEEFPGNQRILELDDRNGDRIIARLDMFADETSNKDKANQLAPSAGGCGELKWVPEQRQDCATDVYERPVDLDGDCIVDGWPSPGKSTALTVPCP